MKLGMTLQLEQHSELIARIRRGDDAPMGAVAELIRASYPELFRQIAGVLGRGQESVSIEPGDIVLIKSDTCVMHREKLIRRRIVRRDEEGREREHHDDKSSDAADVFDYWKEFDAPKNGIATLDWDRPHYGQTNASEQRSGRILIQTFEPLGTASKEIALKQLTDGTRREFVEAFATRSIPPVLNAFFGVRAFLVAPETLLLARPDLHGTDRLQELTRNPIRQDSDHVLAQYPDKHPETFQFFKDLRDVVYSSQERRAEANIEGLPKQLTLDILTAIAVPQIHGTISNLLRMQYAFVQPNRVVGSTLLSAGAALQPAWDITVQLRLLEGMARMPRQFSSI
jgi:hypothetical protein